MNTTFLSVLKNTILIFFTGIVFFWSCTSKKTAIASKAAGKAASTKQKKKLVIPKPDSILVQQEIKRIVFDSILSTELDTTISYEINALYDSLNYLPLWDYTAFPQTLNLLKDCKYDGLYASDYKVELLDSLWLLPATTDSSLSVKMARIDVLMTSAFIKYGKHLAEGKTDPYHLDPNWNYKRRAYSTKEIAQLRVSAKQESPKEYLSYCRPSDRYYASLMKWMKRSYDPEYAFKDTLNIDYPSKSLKKGDSSEVIRRMKYRLKDFQSFAGTKPNGLFDDSLEVALKEFQKYRGLVSDGIAGKSTFTALEMTLAQQRDQIRVNMERARWLFHDLPPEFLLVNIAAYQLYIFRNGKVDYQSNVVVGKLHHETPIFHSTIKYIEFNCTWTVPRKIAVNEILPQIQQDKNYLKTRHFDVLSNGEVVNYTTINFSNYNINNFPFTLRQQPGPYNSLGSMKFVFPNKYSVYLHDTPARYLFEKEGGRAFSHGCVRVQFPDRLAAELLKKNGITQADISKIIEKKETKDVSLKYPMPVFITYWTCYEGKTEKHLYFLQDVYKRDNKVLAALQK